MTIPPAILRTILGSLASLFLPAAGGDRTEAHRAACHTIARHDPQTEEEYRLAAQIEMFGHQALQALALAADPNLPLGRVLRLRGSAVSLSRESHKAQRRLAQVQKARRLGAPSEAQPSANLVTPNVLPTNRTAEKAMVLIAETTTVKAAAVAVGVSWTHAYRQRQREQRLAARRNQAVLATGLVITPA